MHPIYKLRNLVSEQFRAAVNLDAYVRSMEILVSANILNGPMDFIKNYKAEREKYLANNGLTFTKEEEDLWNQLIAEYTAV